MRKQKRKIPFFVHCIKERKVTEISYLLGSRENRAKNYGSNTIGGMLSDTQISKLHKVSQSV